MDKLKMHSPNLVDQNIDKMGELFPSCITESKDEKGNIQKSVDFDLLKQELSRNIVEGPQERYQLNWPGKREALLTANAPIAKTLRPCRDESVNFDSTENLFIEGDNLDALKLLQETYLGKVKMIYIDPPYNTGNDFIYEDDFSEDLDSYIERSNQIDTEGNRLVINAESKGRFHSDWLSMMYSRLKLAVNLLSDDGVMFISLDDGEQGNFRKICDEIFGEGNFVNNIIWQKKYSPQNDAKWLSDNHDFILCYAKNKNTWRPNALPRTEKQNLAYKNPDKDPRGDWKSTDLSVKTYSAANDFEIITPSGRKVNPPKSRCWGVSKVKFNELVQDNRVWFGKDGDNVPSIKKFLTEVKSGVTPLTIWTYQEVGHNQTAKQELKKLFPETADIFDTPKPVSLINRLLQIGSNEDSIILDFFAGSGTTAHSVVEKNLKDGGSRKCITIQIAEETGKKAFKTISDFTKERIRRAGNKAISENVDRIDIEKLDIGFRVLKVDSSNMAEVHYNPDAVSQAGLFDQVENVKEDRTEEDLLFQVMLDWGVDLTLPIKRETIDGNTVFFVADNTLVACFNNTGKITESFVKQLADYEPMRLVFRDGGFESDSAKINVEQVLKQLSPLTDMKSI